LKDYWNEEGIDCKGLEDMDLKAFIQLFNNHTDIKSKMDVEVSIRLAQAHKRIGELVQQLDEKKQECELLQESVNNVANELRETEIVKRQLRESESGLKIQGEQLIEVKVKLADTLSDLDMEKKVTAELSKSLDFLVAERAGLISEVIPYACRALLDSPELGRVLAEVISANRDDERAMVLKDLSDKGQVDLSLCTSFKADTEAAI